MRFCVCVLIQFEWFVLKIQKWSCCFEEELFAPGCSKTKGKFQHNLTHYHTHIVFLENNAPFLSKWHIKFVIACSGHVGMLDSGLTHLPPLGEPLDPKLDPKANSSYFSLLHSHYSKLYVEKWIYQHFHYLIVEFVDV
jgi:hypothetical protein